jgi:hypothetical protein
MDEWDGLEGDDVVEQGAGQVPRWLAALERLQRPGWVARRRWRPSRGAAIVGAAGLALGLVAGYAAGYRQIAAGARSPQGAALASTAAPATRAAPAFGSATAAASGSASHSATPRTCGPGSAPASPIVFPPLPTGQDGQALIRFCAAAFGGDGSAGLASLAVSQTIGACSVQLGHELQLGIEVSNQTGSDVTLQRITASLPLSGGLRAVSWAWGPCGAISSGGGQVAADLSGGEDLSPGESGWFTMTFQVLVKCPGPFPVQFAVRFDSNGRTLVAHVPGFSDLTQVAYSGCAGQ